MSIDLALAHSADKAKGKRPHFLEPQTETVLAITMAVIQELSVTRERLDTLERVLMAGGALSPEAIDAYRPTPAAAAERGLATQEYINRVLRIMQQEGQGIAAAARGEMSSEDVAAVLS